MANEQSLASLGDIDRQLGMSSPSRVSPMIDRSYGNVSAANPVQPVLTSSGVRLNELDEYVIHYRRKIGEGSFGAVYEAVSKKSRKKYAVKVMTLKNIPENFLDSLNREILIAERLDHHNIVKVRHTFRDASHVYIVMDLFEGGDVHDYLENYEYLNECAAFVIFNQLVEAVVYLHSHSIVHRDIKLENLVYDNKKNMHVALTDFGFAVNRLPSDSLLDDYPGSPQYAAPELFLGNPYTGYPADVWAMGICLYVMLTGRYPVDTENAQVYGTQIIRGTIMLPNSLSPAAKDILTRMLQKDEGARATAEQIRNHPWMNYWREATSIKKCPASPKSGSLSSGNVQSNSIGAMSTLGVGVLAGLGSVISLASGRNVAQPIAPVRVASPPSGWNVPHSSPPSGWGVPPSVSTFGSPPELDQMFMGRDDIEPASPKGGSMYKGNSQVYTKSFASTVEAVPAPMGWDNIEPASPKGGIIAAIINSPRALGRAISGMFRSPTSISKDAIDTGLFGGGFEHVFILPPSSQNGSVGQGSFGMGGVGQGSFGMGSVGQGSSGFGNSSPFAFTPSSSANISGQMDDILSSMGL